MDGLAKEPAEWEWKEGGRTGAVLRDLERLFTCSICQGYLAAPQILSGCGHTFCSGCIRQNLETKPACPECRKAGTASDLKPAARLASASLCFRQARCALVSLSQSGHLA
eukprot:6459-Heterococcus_DN1.PRE.2